MSKVYQHDYIDVSRHGSPTYVCRFCDEYKWDIERDGPPECPKAEEALALEQKRREAKEKSEYEGILQAISRFAYLHNKYRDRE